MNDIVIKELEVLYTTPTITYDLRGLEKQVNEINTKYKNLVLKEDDVATAKKEIAQLNKASKAINDQKIAITKLIEQPITEFESKIKEICGKIDEVSKALKKQTDEFANQEKENKRKEILALEEYVIEYMTFNEEWLNKTYTLDKVKVDLAKQKNDFQNQCLLIETTCKALELETEKYFELLTRKYEISYITDMIQNDYDIKNKYHQDSLFKDEEPQIVRITQEDIQDADTYETTLKFSATRTQLKLLKQFLEEKEIKYEKVV